MSLLNECIYRYQKLISLLDQDENDMKYGLEGELLDAYRSIVSKEKQALEQALAELKRLTF